MRRLLHDVQRDLPFYVAAVGLRNAVEDMLARRGHLTDADHVFHGFDPNPRRPPRDGRGRPRDDGLAGSRVPRRPPGGAGAAEIAHEPPVAHESESVA